MVSEAEPDTRGDELCEIAASIRAAMAEMIGYFLELGNDAEADGFIAAIDRPFASWAERRGIRFTYTDGILTTSLTLATAEASGVLPRA
jgi:hypothetical protein